jgi:hypothetical protein
MIVGVLITPSLDEPVSGGSGWLGIGVTGRRPGPGLNPREKGNAAPNQ